MSNLPRGTSWQDLKDHFRKAGDVVFTDVDKNEGTGVVEFNNKEDMEAAVRKMDDTEFKGGSGAGETTFIRVKLAKGGDSSASGDNNEDKREERERSRSRSRDRDEEQRDRERDEHDETRDTRDREDA